MYVCLHVSFTHKSVLYLVLDNRILKMKEKDKKPFRLLEHVVNKMIISSVYLKIKRQC